MIHIFISHSTKDKEWAERLKESLIVHGFGSLFFDSDTVCGISPGELWEAKIHNEIKISNVILLLLSDNWVNSKWCFPEYQMAKIIGIKNIIPLDFTHGENINDIAKEIQHIDLNDFNDKGIDKLIKKLKEIKDQRMEYSKLLENEYKDIGDRWKNHKSLNSDNSNVIKYIVGDGIFNNEALIKMPIYILYLYAKRLANIESAGKPIAEEVKEHILTARWLIYILATINGEDFSNDLLVDAIFEAFDKDSVSASERTHVSNFLNVTKKLCESGFDCISTDDIKKMLGLLASIAVSSRIKLNELFELEDNRRRQYPSKAIKTASANKASLKNAVNLVLLIKDDPASYCNVIEYISGTNALDDLNLLMTETETIVPKSFAQVKIIGILKKGKTIEELEKKINSRLSDDLKKLGEIKEQFYTSPAIDFSKKIFCVELFFSDEKGQYSLILERLKEAKLNILRSSSRTILMDKVAKAVITIDYKVLSDLSYSPVSGEDIDNFFDDLKGVKNLTLFEFSKKEKSIFNN
jgi:ACT domain-containing protein